MCMIRLYCRGNVIEYTGDGWLQCSRQVTCPKKKNNKILGFDCIIYIDGLPENVKLMSPEIELVKEPIKEVKVIKEIPKEFNGISRELIASAPIIAVPSKEEIKEMAKGNGKDNDKQKVGQYEDIDIANVNIVSLAQKMKSAEQIKA